MTECWFGHFKMNRHVAPRCVLFT